MAQLEANTSGGWSCYACDKIQTKVLLAPSAKQRYYCPDCLWEAVQRGRLVVANATDVPAATDGAAPQATTVSLPVTPRDDGSVTIGDIDIRWD